MSRRATIIVAVGAVVLLVAVLLVRRSGQADSAGGSDAATERFFDGYVTADGQVIRHDQGSDTVSEGQAYAMRLAVDSGDRPRFDAVWSWTKAHLQRDDGLFAWRWQDGAIVDDDPAADADFDIADALRVAADAFDDPAYSDEAKRIGSAVLESETVDADGTAGGTLVLVAGTWAVHDRIVNPSYLAPCEYEQFATLTGDQRWSALSDGSFELLRGLISRGLPPDWAVLDDHGAPRAIAAPDDRDSAGRYGLDAYRVPARLAACSMGRDLAAQLAPRIERLADDGGALAYSLDGKVAEQGSHPLGLVSGALTADAVGDDDRASSLMDHAAKVDREHPTYYGAAWIALAYDLIDGRAETAGSDTTAAAIGQSEATPAGFARGAGLRLDLATVHMAAPTGAATTTSVAGTAGATPTTDQTDTSTAATVAAPTTTRPSGATTTAASTPSPSVSSTTAPTTTADSGATPTTSPPATATTAPTGDSVPGTGVTDSTVATEDTVATDDTMPTDSSILTSDSAESSGAATDDDTSTTAAGVDPTRRHSSGAVDLASSSPDIDEFIPGASPALRGETKLETQRQHTGAISLAGLIATTVLGAGFGLRERSVVRKAQSLQQRSR